MDQAAELTPPTWVIEGVSPWAEQSYFPVVARLLSEGHIQDVHVTDDSRTYANSRKTQREVAKRKRDFKKKYPQILSHVHFIDKAADDGAYNDLTAEAVFVVTPPISHAQIARHWVDRGDRTVVFIEKPLCVDTVDPDLEPLLASDKVYNIDHYLVRAALLASLCDSPKLVGGLGTLKKLTLRMIEEGGIGDLDRPSLKDGLILDMMCHLLALVHPFGALSSIDLDDHELRVAKCDAAPEWYHYETFAEVSFRFRFHSTNAEVLAVATIGKGVARDAEDPRPGKYLELEGEDGKLVANLEGDFAVRTELRGKQARWYGDLRKDAYYPSFREIARGSYLEGALLFPHDARRILELLGRMRRSFRPAELSTYPPSTPCSQIVESCTRYPLVNPAP